MARGMAQVLGVLALGLALIGLLVGNQQWGGGLLNTDLALDLIRLPVAAALLYAGFIAGDDRTTDGIVRAAGALYILLGLLGMVSPALFGLLPHHLTGLDITFHLAAGVLAMANAESHSHGRGGRHSPVAG